MTATPIAVQYKPSVFRILSGPAAPALVAALAALLVYACTLRGTYIYDDIAVIQKDGRMDSVSKWKLFWTKQYTNAPDKLYRPLTSTTFAIQRALTGERAWPFHLVNWLLHAAVAAAVAEFGRRLAGLRTAWFAGVLFAVHPVHVEVVAGLVGRAEILCALGMLLALCAFLGKPLSPGRIVFIAVCCAVAMLSKEQGMLSPVLVFALVPLHRSRPELAAPPSRKTGLWLTVTLVYMLAAYLFLRERLIGFGWDRRFIEWVMNPMIRSHGMDRALMPLVLAGRYLILLVAPHRQSFDYGGHVIGWTVSVRDPYLYLGIFAVLLWIGLAVLSLRRRNWAVLFCLLAFALTYGMIGNIVALIGTIFAERLMYDPSIFFILLVAIGLARLPLSLASPLVVVLTIAGGLSAFAYARLWNDPIALYSQCVRNRPGSERAYDMLNWQYVGRGDWWASRRISHEALAALPDTNRPYEMCIEADLHTGGSLADAWRLYGQGMSHTEGFDRLYFVEFGGDIKKIAASTQPSASTQPAR
jgi:protein O-mannosyl-transferase